MNKKTVFMIIFIVSTIAGLSLGYFTDVANDLPAIGLTAFGLGGLILTTWKKSEKKNGFLVASMICMVVSGVAAAFAEVTQDSYSKMVAAVVAVIGLITSLLIPVISNALSKNKKKTE